jgi:DNA-binding MarR family transcriptional regulator
MAGVDEKSRSESTSKRRSGAHLAVVANGQSLADESLRPVEGVDYDALLELAGFWLRRLHIGVLKSYDKHLTDIQVRPVEAAALILLRSNPELTQNALAGALGTDQSTMVGISTRLEERGFIERRRQSSDRRYQILSLTAAGRKTTAIVERRLRAHNENILRNLSAEERRSFFKLLIKIVD